MKTIAVFSAPDSPPSSSRRDHCPAGAAVGYLRAEIVTLNAGLLLQQTCLSPQTGVFLPSAKGGCPWYLRNTGPPAQRFARLALENPRVPVVEFGSGSGFRVLEF